MLENILDKSKKCIKDNVEKIQELNNKIVDNTNNMFSSIKSSFNIENIEKKLEYIGYDISKVEISLTIPPRILFQIDLNKSNLNLEKQNEIFEENESNDLLIIKKIIDGINQALDLKEKIIFNSKELKYLEIEVSLIPTIKLVYLDK